MRLFAIISDILVNFFKEKSFKQMRKSSTLLIIALLLGSFIRLDAQDKNQVKKKMFDFEALDFYSPEGTKSRVDIYVEIPLGNFEFKKSKEEKNKYISDFDLTIDVFDLSEVRVYDNVSKEELSTTQTSSEYLQGSSQIIPKNLFLTPGTYKIRLTIYETDTKRSSEEEKEITVRDFTAPPFSLSDIMLVSKLSETNGKKIITPSVSNEVGSLDTFALFFYVYKNATDQEIDISCKITDADNKEVYSTQDNLPSTAGAFQNQFIFPVSTAGLNYGKFQAEITATNAQHTDKSVIHFTLGNADFPFSLNNIDELIDQLQYIAKEKEMDYMKAGKTVAEKQKRFMEFWKSKDPNPATKKNEAMDEYYRRLFYANKHFGTTYTNGWRTDMGMVFIIFGAPSNVDKHPYDMDTKPYEVWDYYDINKEFVFVDNDGFGDYRLVTPIWDTFRYGPQN